jgi:quercetin dioxygenase-like cupin family protein
VNLYRWPDIPEEALNPLFSRRVVHTARLTIAQLRLKKGCIVPQHAHANEQFSTVESGKLRFIVDGVAIDVGADESLAIPPHAPHEVEALEDTVVLDIFTPAREDWIRGDDAYLRR